MSRTATIQESDLGKDPLKRMVEMSERPHYIHGPNLLVSPTQSLPTREKMIADCMAIPEYGPMLRVGGRYVEPEPTYWPREKAERAADVFFAAYAKWEAHGVALIERSETKMAG